jgi:hypothetical protein
LLLVPLQLQFQLRLLHLLDPLLNRPEPKHLYRAGLVPAIIVVGWYL